MKDESRLVMLARYHEQDVLGKTRTKLNNAWPTNRITRNFHVAVEMPTNVRLGRRPTSFTGVT